MIRSPLFAAIAALGCCSLTAQQLPCGTAPVPAYAAEGAAPAVQVWTSSNWIPPGCTGWSASDSATLVATAGRFRMGPRAGDLFQRAGAISKLKGLLYWSTTEKKWRPLILDASALSGPDGVRRPDFALAEIAAGRILWAEEEDNLLGKAVYRIRILESTENRLVFATENHTPLRFLGLSIFAPGDLQSLCFLDRESKNLWRYYSIVRMSKPGAMLLSGQQASLINRAVASYRFIAGIPPDQEPPAAR